MISQKKKKKNCKRVYARNLNGVRKRKRLWLFLTALSFARKPHPEAESPRLLFAIGDFNRSEGGIASVNYGKQQSKLNVLCRIAVVCTLLRRKVQKRVSSPFKRNAICITIRHDSYTEVETIRGKDSKAFVLFH